MRALALFSGGLDSTLAMKLIIDQGIEVVAVHIDMGFGGTNDKRDYLQNLCNQIGAKLEILDLRKEFLDEVLFTPKYGYGKNFNPCIDCHGFMFRYTSKLLEKFDASFMISGEVLGQRPMSQKKESLDIVKQLSQNDELILRPLSAKLLEPTKPEIEGWVYREKLLDISGRNRQIQLNMAKDIGLEGFEEPAGGCLLTHIETTARIRDFISHDKLEVDDIDILKFGRHLRLPEGAKLVIGRNEADNLSLEKVQTNKFYRAKIQDAIGPFSMLSKNATEADKAFATKLILTYGKTEAEKIYTVDFEDFQMQGVKFLSKDVAAKYFVQQS
ncbi:argininosuccinate synthase domain-containing protein [Arcobacter sp. FWKO B]|uniref:argininosuccinate synthase domain-containing protein n=1 Tax=Arcobacter sp. FWKO B TaxID=2593672 RepID=UPI0018A4D0DE|nr:argininosuccinate synthase domain-containing protein [Arcobacter sp. FWKO B]QOG13053.1 ATP-binding protein [Arcobacter sp. FWKO B]